MADSERVQTEERGEPRLHRFEYLQQVYLTTPEMNAMGAEGWELVNVLCFPSEPKPVILTFWKREVQ